MTIGDRPRLTQEFEITGGSLAKGGEISIKVKSILKSIGFPPEIIRRASIACYEAEINVVMYARRAMLRLVAEPERISIEVLDEGQGIPDIDQAMQEGFSTATHEQRELGFGAGMGLPNIMRNTDEMTITSEVGKGTELRFSIKV